ncbi:helix-turn-helix transcriptional regulator [Clostridium perfringens]|uniref:helix-turn-helix transcriptional regulator n=1 Tax=Clostridium perfringens TaxID=1502 RepID=UPI0001663C71|nr:helix-turn-helix domain-containing protein [Clostridium perfringens]EDS79201.1 BcrR [Clostridium perfringens C str. JGS1495]ELC8449532.1 helix-turn-helix transcriptional regulator [Clostridium perfringens]MBI6029097.1 helix-turn-helix transcriptional regulator [Clostridium perfringens]MBI6032603.1 helix-turn-helix transcriptional regulator [Clostridium perfringens]MBI6067171.1 helix-turn-helix transcriptional regulator [Clostridium perfringens]
MNELIAGLPWYKKIEILRIIKGWTQEEAAEKCFTKQKAYWTWEKGNAYPRKNSRRAISQAFEVDENEIFKEEKENVKGN